MENRPQSALSGRGPEGMAARASHLSPVLAGEDYYYRPNDLLLTQESARALGDLLRREYDARPYEPGEGWRQTLAPAAADIHGRLNAKGVGVELWRVPDGVHLPDLVTKLRTSNDERAPAVSLNHVFAGEPTYKGGPGGPPDPMDNPGSPWDARTSRSTSVDLAVLDTGVPASLATLHPNLQACVVMEGADLDELDDDHDGLLDDQAGHGAFICGLVHLVSPGLGIDTARVLDSTGYGDDLSVALGLAETSAQVINLSLGGYTQDDNPPLALAQAIAALGRSRIVVAAAGNNASDRPFWPAALKGVVAVAAYDSKATAPAKFSNFGPWVDVCAPGVGLLSTFVDGARFDGVDDVTFKGWARWSGTSFAAPLVGAEIADRLRKSNGRTARQVALELLSELPESDWPGFGALYTPDTDPAM